MSLQTCAGKESINQVLSYLLNILFMKSISLFILLFFTQTLNAQKTLPSVIKENTQTFVVENNHFSGRGWNVILNQIKTHNNVLIGEDHFLNEIPFFISQIADEVKFDNFFCEIDPYSAKMMEAKIRTLSESDLNEYIHSFSNTFSFYALTPEFNLLKKLVLSNTEVIGTDQILLVADRLIASELKERTKNESAKSIYSEIENQSAVHYNQFTKGTGKPYFFTDKFIENLNKLDSLKLSPYEQTVIKDLKLSQRIYLEQNHHLRIQLMKHNLMLDYKSVAQSKNIFKYGANHLPKGESLLEIQDLGNLINNIADSEFQSSLHIMIIGKSGLQGIPFKGLEYQKIDPNSGDLKHYKAFFDAVDKDEWHIFDNKEILKELTLNKITIENKTLARVIKGYDYLIVIPEVTPAEFLD
jgi:hypothetical protein